MIKLNEISKIGFGAYRLKKGNPEHEDSLKYAINNGCNLIDTASSYGNGDSENLIGEVLDKVGKKNDLFIISKAGYFLNSNKKLFNILRKNKLFEDDIVEISSDYTHSIHPKYLEYEINESLKRLKRKYIDCYLLHNPEYHFKNDRATEEKYYEKIFNAFRLLENKVEEGILRYYGISSNTFPFSEDEKNKTKLNRIIDIANIVSNKNHFKFIQFPFNLIENSAELPNYNNYESLMSIARKNGITMLSNRPLNTNTPHGALRLASYDETISEDDLLDSMNNLFLTIEEKLKKEGCKEKALDFEVFEFIQKKYRDVNNHKIFDLLNDMMSSFIETLYKNDVPQDSKKIIQTFIESLERWSRKQSSYKAKKILNSLNIDTQNKSISYMVIDTYLSKGIDHVLCGMKKMEYVDDLKSLF